MRTATLLLLAAVMTVCPVLISCDKPVEPTVGHIPEGWSLSAQHPYGTYWEKDGTRWGLVEYTDESDWDSVAIFYGDVPPELKGNETDVDTLIDWAADCLAPIEPTQLGTITIASCLAGYARAYDEEHDWYDMEIVFVMGSTCIDIYTCYGATYVEDEIEVMSLIDSIH